MERIREHLTSKDYTGTKSLKLGFTTRSGMKQKLRCYIGIVPLDKNTLSFESKIREFGAYFGEK